MNRRQRGIKIKKYIRVFINTYNFDLSQLPIALPALHNYKKCLPLKQNTDISCVFSKFPQSDRLGMLPGYAALRKAWDMQ